MYLDTLDASVLVAQQLLNANKMTVTVYFGVAKTSLTVHFNDIIYIYGKWGLIMLLAPYLTESSKLYYLEKNWVFNQSIAVSLRVNFCIFSFFWDIYINHVPEIFVNGSYLYSYDMEITSTVDNKTQMEKGFEGVIFCVKIKSCSRISIRWKFFSNKF